jgi:hypothetical protein
MRRIKLPQLGVVIAVCALVGALAGIAGSAAAPSKSSKSPKASSSAATKRAFPRHAPGGRGMLGPGGPAVHAEAVVPNKAGTGFTTVTTDGGTVKSVSGNDITIDESVGSLHYKDVTVTVPSDATVIRNHAKASVSDIQNGDEIRVIASSEKTIVVAESEAFQKQERQRFRKMFRDHGPWDHHGPGGPGQPGFNGAPPAAPQGGGSTY